MTAFWLTATIMVMLAAAAVLVPLWLYRPRSDISQDELNTRIFRERLAELDSEFRERRIDQQHYEQLRAELERTLLGDVSPSAAAPRRAGFTRIGGVAAALLLPLLALAYYYTGFYRGESGDWIALQDRFNDAVLRAIRQPETLPEQALQDLPGFTRVLQARVLREGLDDPDSLFLLGISLLQLQVPQEALGVLQRAHRLAPERIDVMLAYAQALMLGNEGKLTPLAARLLHTVLQQQPEHQGALMMLGFGAFNAGDYGMAVSAWKPLLASLDPQSEAARLLTNSIARAEQLAQEPSPAAETAQQVGSTARIAVTVELAPELRARLRPDDTLFIFAKAASGPPMPLAAVRQPAKEFPVQVVLDDSKSMLPSLKLSNFREIIVGARVSQAGDVTARPGDLEGLSEPLDLTEGPLSVSLTVNRVVQ